MTESSSITVSAKGMGDEVIKAIHASKSYVSMALITLLLYYIGFYVVGLVANLIFISQANESKRISGSEPSGRGCLIFLLWTHLLIPIILLIMFAAGGLALLNL